MFNIGPAELLIIGLVLLIAVGPEQLPGVIRRVGSTVAQFRSMTDGLRGEFMAGLEEIERATDIEKWSADDAEAATSSRSTASKRSTAAAAATAAAASDDSVADDGDDADPGADEGGDPAPDSSDDADPSADEGDDPVTASSEDGEVGEDSQASDVDDPAPATPTAVSDTLFTDRPAATEPTTPSGNGRAAPAGGDNGNPGAVGEARQPDRAEPAGEPEPSGEAEEGAV